MRISDWSSDVCSSDLPGDPADIVVDLHVSAGRPTVDVRDQGPGIAQELRDRLFRPFFTTSEHGTGLGLYIARELCRANEAQLDYVARADRRHCFRIVLPEPPAQRPDRKSGGRGK